MNTLILTADQFIDSKNARLSERQRLHVENVLKLTPGATLRAAELNGAMGHGVFDLRDGNALITDIVLDSPPPASLALTLILAMPRPQMLKRILQTVACFGVEKLVLIQSNRVEKSFWQSPSAQEGAIQEQLILGLEQANATQLPKVRMFQRFKPFIEDSCAELTANSNKMVLHPGPFPFFPNGKLVKPTSLVIGPEGGFTEYEMALWQEYGFEPRQLGERILRVETAVTSVLARCLG